MRPTLKLRRAKRRRTAIVAAPARGTLEAVQALQPLVERAIEHADEADAPATKKAYLGQWRRFEAWCSARGLPSLPAADVVLAAYLTEKAGAGASNSTLEQVLAAVAKRHELADAPSPVDSRPVRQTWKGIRRGRVRRGEVIVRRAEPVGPALLRAMIQTCDGGLACVRDRALLLLGFAAALRRIELVLLDVEHLLVTDDGIVVLVKRSKTDQEGKGAKIGIPYGADRVTCPVRAVKDWLAVSGIESGAVFRGVRKGDRLSPKRLDGGDVSRILKRFAARVGIEVDRISGHSLRRGFGTSSAHAKKGLTSIQKHMRHKRVEQTLEYIEEAEMFNEDNAASGIGL